MGPARRVDARVLRRLGAQLPVLGRRWGTTPSAASTRRSATTCRPPRTARRAPLQPTAPGSGPTRRCRRCAGRCATTSTTRRAACCSRSPTWPREREHFLEQFWTARQALGRQGAHRGAGRVRLRRRPEASGPAARPDARCCAARRRGAGRGQGVLPQARLAAAEPETKTDDAKRRSGEGRRRSGRRPGDESRRTTRSRSRPARSSSAWTSRTAGSPTRCSTPSTCAARSGSTTTPAGRSASPSNLEFTRIVNQDVLAVPMHPWEAARRRPAAGLDRAAAVVIDNAADTDLVRLRVALPGVRMLGRSTRRSRDGVSWPVGTVVVPLDAGNRAPRSPGARRAEPARRDARGAARPCRPTS